MKALGCTLALGATHAAQAGVYVHLFEWRWPDVARECETFLGPRGYTAVQVSPPNEHLAGSAWWTRHQPVSYQLDSRGGSRAQFIDMVQRCNAAGVAVYADLVVNHTGNGSGTGVAGTPWNTRKHPMYGANDDHNPRVQHHQLPGRLERAELRPEWPAGPEHGLELRAADDRQLHQ